MFKIFYNNKILLLSEHESDDNSFTKINFLSEVLIKNELNIFLNNEQSANLNIYGKYFTFIPEIITNRFKIIYAAGGVVLDKKGNVLFINRLGYYDFPKGKLEHNETAETGAIREVCEECGILASDLRIERFLTNIYHIYPLKGNFILKQTSWFLMHFYGDYQLKPQIEEDITNVDWMEKSQFDKFKEGTYPSLVELIEFL